MHKYIILFILSLFSPLLWAQSDLYVDQSVLSEGSWVRIEIEETGIYKLTYDALRKMGFQDPSKVSVHGYGGWLLNEDFSKPFIDDLPATAIWKGTDYILFYGRGVRKWEYQTKTNSFEHTNNHYATTASYFLTDTSPKMMEKEVESPNATLTVSDFDDYYVHEKEIFSPNKSGRQLFGESLEGGNHSLTIPSFNISGMTQDDGKVTMRFMTRSINSNGTASLKINNEEVLTLSIPRVTGNHISYNKGNVAEKTATWSGEKEENMKLNVLFSPSGHTNVRLDYIRLQMKRKLKPYGAYTLFRNIASIDAPTRFVIQEANEQTLVFDVTDPVSPMIMNAHLSGSELSFSIPAGSLREFVIIQPDKNGFLTPKEIGKVANQNLHGLDATDMVILTIPAMRSEAERLAEEHRKRDGLTVEVVEPQAIYNEFSSGTPDASAYRRFMKMFYDRATTEAERPKHLLLFGDGVYDNRGLCVDVSTSFPKEEIHKKLLLTYQSENSLNIHSYVTDDYFAFLNDETVTATGQLKSLSQWKMDISVGRLPIRTLSEATAAVDKLVAYMDNKLLGSWKNNLCFVADDGNNADGYSLEHAIYADRLADYVEENDPSFINNKVYFDAYKKDFSGQTSYPDVQKRMQQLLKNGLMMINYIGHGSTSSWSDEKVLTESDVTQANYQQLPLWIASTCDFSRFDDPVTSAGEQVFLNKTSGGIALISTARVAFTTQNQAINELLMANLLNSNRKLTLGEVLKNAKNARSNDDNKLCFVLLGDPALKISYPQYDIQVTTVNGKPAADEQLFRALDKITIEGMIRDREGAVMENFNGFVNATVFDSKDSIRTLGNNRDVTFEYTDYPNTLFIGNNYPVTNGKFSFTFVVPKDISYSDDFGKMTLYAADEQSGVEAKGAFSNYRVGGTNDNVEGDIEAPEIRSLYLNDSTFVSGDRVNTTPLFVAKLWDKSGVNISGSSIGHDITLIIDNNPVTSYNLNSYYENVIGGENEGIVIFPIPKLAAGTHIAEFIVWDIHNNSSKMVFTFVVDEGLKPSLTELFATPNPAREQVVFHLRHNRPESHMKVHIHVYDMTGRLCWQNQIEGSSDLFKDFTIRWDMRDNSGSRLRPGIYVYRAAVTTDRSSEATKANKLIILAQ